MREYISYKDIANTVMMLGTSFKGTIAVVEGLTDRRLYGKFFDRDDVEVVVAHSKDNVCNSVKETFENRGKKSVLGIVDSDLDILMNKKKRPPLFTTDTRDSESLMFMSNCFDYVMQEYAEPDSVKKFESRHGDVRECVYEASYPIGMLMYIARKHGFSISFKDLDFEYFISRRDLTCDVEKLIESLLRGSSGALPSAGTLLTLYYGEPRRPYPEVCRGHDIMSVMAIGLRYIFGGSNCRHITGDELAGGFRLSYSEADMRSTKLYSESGIWCRENGLRLWEVTD